MSKKLSTIVGGGVTSTGALPVANGGTGATSAAAALVALGAQATMSAASATVSGYLTSADWTTFNSKQAALTLATGVTTFLATPSSANLAAAVTDETGTGSLVFANNPSVITPLLTGVKEVRVAMAANNIDLLLGNYFTKTISGATTLTVSNVPAAGVAGSIILDLTNGGSAAITWWGVKWVGGTAPTLTSAGRDTLGFFTHDGGTTWSGFVMGKDVK